MDQIRPEFGVSAGQTIPCKVSIINEQGHIVLDTLVKPSLGGIDIEDVQEIEGFKSLKSIHGIPSEWLTDAPSFKDVREHIMELCGKVPIQINVEEPSEDCDPCPIKSYEAIDRETYDPKIHSVFIGHGVTFDLKVMGIYDAPYYDT